MGWMSAICDAHKKVGVELLYNSVKTGSQLVWTPDRLVTSCGRESQHPAEWALRPPVEQHQEKWKETLMAIRVGVNMLQFCSVSNSLSHTTFQIKWEVQTVSLVFIMASLSWFMHASAYDYTTLSWCPSSSNSLWQGWSCGLLHCPGGNATDPISRVLASSQGISSWSTLKPQESYPNPHPSADQLWCIDFLIPCTPLIIPHRLPGFLESLMPLKNWCSIHAGCSKSSLKNSICFCGIFPSLKKNFIAYCSSKVSSRPDCIFEIDQLWQSGFSRVCSNCCCSCLFEAETMKISQSSHKMYSNNILNSQESKTILNAPWKKIWKLVVYTSYIS